LAMSNMMAAAMLMQLMWVHEMLIPEWLDDVESSDVMSIINQYPIELRRTEFGFESFNTNQIKQLMEEQHVNTD